MSYRFRVDANDLAKKAEGGLLPIFKKQPGFRDYSLFADRSEIAPIALHVSPTVSNSGNVEL